MPKNERAMTGSRKLGNQVTNANCVCYRTPKPISEKRDKVEILKESRFHIEADV